MSIESEYVWQDRELRFDSSEAHLQCRAGEKVIDSINSVEDTKGRPGLYTPALWLCCTLHPAPVLMLPLAQETTGSEERS